MEYLPNLATLAVAHLLAAMLPGPNMLMVGRWSLVSSRRDGALAATGVVIASLFWVVLSLSGVGALLVEAGALYRILRLIGAAYLVYVGVRRAAAGGTPTGARTPGFGSARHARKSQVRRLLGRPVPRFRAASRADLVPCDDRFDRRSAVGALVRNRRDAVLDRAGEVGALPSVPKAGPDRGRGDDHSGTSPGRRHAARVGDSSHVVNPAAKGFTAPGRRDRRVRDTRPPAPEVTCRSRTDARKPSAVRDRRRRVRPRPRSPRAGRSRCRSAFPWAS